MKEVSHSSPALPSNLPLFVSSHLLTLLVCLTPAVSSEAQSLDEQLFRRVYHADAPAFRAAMRAADWSAYPVFVAAPIGAWTAARLGPGISYAEAYRWSLAEGVAFAGTAVLKRLYQRKRPGSELPEVRPRLNRVDQWVLARDAYSFPSGHAALSAALATVWSLSRPEWYVVTPSVAWASAVAVSRVWIGVHYPSDVFAGIAIGMAVGAVVHVLRTALTPDALREEAALRPAVHLQVDLR